MPALAVRRAVTGDEEVNLAYHDRPYTVMEQPRLLTSPDVAALSAALCGIDLDTAFSELSDPQLPS
ncbi:hypothetical protein [Actinoallomurus iriomotensis]|uniref:Uncharacterized protein n=1 Tax=Actinoallomurus iriomotensis TaxID=478107 RepID=A0A9W6S0F5_9ACTN|nr:hypothetical protein [Actinoallomurus iriomotensis]GLY83387.1 hypothetical protein Airi02_013170 [Actinoallomurus iriomotensis]